MEVYERNTEINTVPRRKRRGERRAVITGVENEGRGAPFEGNEIKFNGALKIRPIHNHNK